MQQIGNVRKPLHRPSTAVFLYGRGTTDATDALIKFNIIRGNWEARQATIVPGYEPFVQFIVPYTGPYLIMWNEKYGHDIKMVVVDRDGDIHEYVLESDRKFLVLLLNGGGVVSFEAIDADDHDVDIFMEAKYSRAYDLDVA